MFLGYPASTALKACQVPSMYELRSTFSSASAWLMQNKHYTGTPRVYVQLVLPQSKQRLHSLLADFSLPGQARLHEPSGRVATTGQSAVKHQEGAALVTATTTELLEGRPTGCTGPAAVASPDCKRCCRAQASNKNASPCKCQQQCYSCADTGHWFLGSVLLAR